MVVATEDGIRFPALPVKEGVVCAVAAAFGGRLLRLKVLVSRLEGGVKESLRCFEGLMSSRSPVCLIYVTATYQPG